MNDDTLTPTSSPFAAIPIETRTDVNTNSNSSTMERNEELNGNGIEMEEDASTMEEVSPEDLLSVVSATPSNVQEEYRQEYLALSSRNITHQLVSQTFRFALSTSTSNLF